MTEQLHFHFSLSHIGEGNGNPLQCSGLENPRDGGAWWAAIYGVAQSQTRLKRLSSSSSSRGWGGDMGVNQLSRRGALFSFPRFLCCHDSWKLPSIGKCSRYSVNMCSFIDFIFPIAAAAKSLQSCLTLCNPIDGSPPGSPIPGILQSRTLEWVAISFSNA